MDIHGQHAILYNDILHSSSTWWIKNPAPTWWDSPGPSSSVIPSKTWHWHTMDHMWTSFFWLHLPDFIQNSDSWLFRDVPMFQISESNISQKTPRYRSSRPPARCNASQRPCSSSMPGGFSRISWTSEIRTFWAPGKNGETPHQKGELWSVGVAPANSA